MHARWQTTSLSGEGAALFPGRWNMAGERMVYMADSLALAVLETLVHLEVTATAEPYTAIEFSLPDEAIEPVHPVPAGWQHDITITRQFGSEWLRAGKSLTLRVPSAIVPAGENLLIDPTHTSASHVNVLRTLPFRWDPRLF